MALEIGGTAIEEPEVEEEKASNKKKDFKSSKPKNQRNQEKKPESSRVAKVFKEVEGGFYDEMSFYILPNEQGNIFQNIHIF